MRIKTTRLDIYDLSLQQWKDFYQRPDQLELFFGVEPSPKLMDPNYKREYIEMLPALIKVAEKDEENLCWYTQWVFIQRRDKVILGGFNFTGPPTRDGGIYLGFFSAKSYDSHNYLVEAMRAIISWAFKQPRVNYIVTETARGDIEANKVLDDVGFSKQKQGAEMIPWIIVASKTN